MRAVMRKYLLFAAPVSVAHSSGGIWRLATAPVSVVPVASAGTGDAHSLSFQAVVSVAPVAVNRVSNS